MTEGRSTEPLYRELQLIHERYFRDVADACADAQSRSLSIQTEFQRNLEKAYQSQQPELFREVQNEYQQKIQSFYNEEALPQQYVDAYSKYKASLKQLISETDINEFGYSDVWTLGQSLVAVSTAAMNFPQLNATPSAAVNDPFSPPSGAA